MTERPEDFTRRAAMALGEGVEGALSMVVDQLENLSLWAMEQAAGVAPQSEGLSLIGRMMGSLRRLSEPVPRLAGRLAAGSTYFGLRLGVETYRSTRQILEETSEFMGTDGARREK